VKEKKVTFENPKIEWGMDLQSEHERYVAEQHVKGGFFAYNYPKDIKSFYMRANEDGKTVASMDLLVPYVFFFQILLRRADRRSHWRLSERRTI